MRGELRVGVQLNKPILENLPAGPSVVLNWNSDEEIYRYSDTDIQMNCKIFHSQLQAKNAILLLLVFLLPF